MELALFVYASGVIGQISIFLGNIAGFTIATGCILLGGVAFTAPFLFDEDMTKKETRDKVLACVKKAVVFFCIPVAFLTSCTQAVLPSEKTMYLMGGAWATQAVVQSETADKVLKIVNGKLDEYLVDMEKSVKEGAN